MRNIEVLMKYSDDPDFINMKEELQFSLFAVDNEFFEGNATYDKVSEFIYNSETGKTIIDLLVQNQETNTLVLAKTILSENTIEIQTMIDKIFIEMNNKDSEILDDIKSELNEDNEEIIIFICLSNNLTKESLIGLKNTYKARTKNKKIKVMFKTVNDILLTEKENSESLSYVDSDELVLDSPENYLRFDENKSLGGILVNVKTESIHRLYDKYYQRGLLGANIRYFVKNKQIDDKIKDTLLNEGDLF
jgi:hypothetical protein